MRGPEMGAHYGIITLKVHESGADPDSLYSLEYFESADYTELGFPSQGLAHSLHQAGVLTKDGKDSKARTRWTTGPIYERWRRHYSQHRAKFRTTYKLPLNMNSKIISRMIIQAGYDPDVFVDLSAMHVADLKDMKLQALALISMGFLQPIPCSRYLGPGRYYEAWAKEYPEHRDEVRRVYKLPMTPLKEVMT
jgi:hypothetical protein